VQADHGGLPQHCSGQIIILHCPALQVLVSFLFSLPVHSSAVPGLVAAQNYNSSTRRVNMRHCVALGQCLARTQTGGVRQSFHTR
jgi:hypothetical protein